MQRLLALGQRRPPFPSSFFTSASSSINSRCASQHSSRWSSPHASSSSNKIRSQSFGDSSRSRPPPSNKSSSGGGSGSDGSSPAKPASKNSSNNSKTVASTTASPSSSSNEASTSASSTPSTSSTPSAAKKARILKANSRTTGGNGRKLRLDPFARSAAGSSTTYNNSKSWLPRSIEPVQTLDTHPAQITLDGFYALNRPLLQVTVPFKQRRYPSAQDAQPMEIVGKSEFTEEQIQAGQQDPFAEDQIGQYDLHLVTEPEGADPEWAEGTDKYMASLEHNVPPPVPTASTSTATPSPSKKVSKKVSQRQEAIDYLFPFQAEARKAAQESESSSSDKVDKSLGAQIQRLLNMEGYEVSLDGSGPSRGHGFDGALTGQRFLVNQLMKHKWSGMWEWEPTRQALIAASKKASSGTLTKSSTDAKGKGKATAADKEGNLNMQKSLDQLRKASKAGARASAKAGKQAAAAAAKLRAAAPNDVQTLWVSMPMDGSAPRIVELPNQKKNDSKRDAKEEEEEENEIDAAVETAKREPLFAEEEIRQVLEQAEKFQGFFNKSIDVELQKKGPKASAAAEGETNIFTEVNKRLSTKNENAVIDEAYLDGAMGEWVSEQEFDSNGDIILQGDMHDSRFVNDLPSDEYIDARWRASGSRLSALQAYRGRSLRATLQERLSLKGVELVGTYKWIEMDSVKRKRRKRISKHKYKKRRKATRSERRRLGK